LLELPGFRKLSDNNQKAIQLKYSYFITALTLAVKDKE
jgi:hypothetical protein